MDFTPSEVVFKQVGEAVLKLHVFGEEERDRGEPVPGIVFFFGGGWQGGTPTQFFPHCQYLALRGMVAISAEYRVKSRHGVTPLECVLDARSAVRWVHAHAGELGVDPERISVGGGSAGGHVAACTAVLKGMGDDDGVTSVPKALVLFNPVVDTVRAPIGPKRFGDLAEALSPLHHVRPDLPPAIIFHGMADTTVPYAEVEQFCALMHEAGNRCELVGFENKGHAFFNYGRDENKPYEETVRAMDVFLASLGFLAGPPAI
jgi:acetyl esterase/lipase